MPTPGALDDGVDVLKLWLPSEFTLDFFGRGDETRGIARSACLLDGGNFMTGNFPARFDHFADAGAATSPEIVEFILRRFQSEDVRLR